MTTHKKLQSPETSILSRSLINPMKASCLVLVGACMVLIAGCRSAEKAPTATANAPSGKEYQTVEFVQHSEADVRERLVQWQREGWALHSLVTVRQMEDGAKLRKAELSRSGASSEDRKTAEFVDRTPSDLKEHMAQWAREGWSVRNVRRIPQADGTVLFKAELARPQSSTAQPR